MLTFIAENIATIVVCLIILCVVFLIIRKMIKDKKEGKSSCGCGCSNCPGCAAHHHEHKQ